MKNEQQITFEHLETEENIAKAKAVAAEFERQCKAVALGMGRKEFSILSGISYTYANEILNANNEQAQKPLQLPMIGSLMVGAPELFTNMVIDFCNRVCGNQPAQKKRPMTPEEENGLLWRKIKAHGLEKIFEDLDDQRRRK